MVLVSDFPAEGSWWSKVQRRLCALERGPSFVVMKTIESRWLEHFRALMMAW